MKTIGKRFDFMLVYILYMFQKLFANCLLVEDFDRSMHFYRDILGLTVNSVDGKFADFKLEGTSLAIFQRNEATVMFPEKYMGSTGGVVLCFQVPDVAKACNELTGKGVKIFEGPKTVPWGQTVAYFKDPDGHIWEITD